MASAENHPSEFPMHNLSRRTSESPQPSIQPEDTQHTPTESTQNLLPQGTGSNSGQTEQNARVDAKILINGKFHLSPLEWLLHLASIIFTISVLYLCGAEVYFLDITKPNINTILNLFQFVAALHGIVIAISLGAVTLYHLKYELYVASGLPYEYVPATFQLGSLKLLFEPRFWRALFANTNTARTYLFGAGIVISTVILTLVPPSSAILLVPQLEWWKVDQPFGGTKGFSYLNGSHSYLWPNSIHASMVPKECDGKYLIDIPKNCPHSNMVAITDWSAQYINQFAPPNITATTNANMVRFVGGSVIHPRRGYSAVTTGMNHITAALGDIWRFANRHPRVPMQHYGRPKITLSSQNYTQPIMRPLVQTQCAPPRDITDIPEIYEASFPTNQLIPSSGQRFTSSLSKKVNISISRTFSPAVDFVDLSEEAGMPLLGALIGMNFTNAVNLSFSRNEASGLMACTIAPYWIPTNMSTDPNVDNVAILDNADPLDIVNSTELMDRAVPIDLDLSYARRVNIHLLLGINVLEHELRPIAIIRSPKYIYDGSWGERWSWVGATLLSMQLSDALASVKSTMPMMTYCELCANQITDPGSSTLINLSIQNRNYSSIPRYNESTGNYVNGIQTQPDHYMSVQWSVQRYGYGWGLTSATEWLAATVILLHTFLIFAHLLVVFMRKKHFEGWDGLGGFVALANNSPGLEKLKSLGLGETAHKTFAGNVMVRKCEEGSHAILTSSDMATS